MKEGKRLLSLWKTRLSGGHWSPYTLASLLEELSTERNYLPVLSHHPQNLRPPSHSFFFNSSRKFFFQFVRTPFWKKPKTNGSTRLKKAK